MIAVLEGGVQEISSTALKHASVDGDKQERSAPQSSPVLH